MESAFSDEFKRYFLLTFTKELILHSTTRDITKLQKIIDLKERRKERKFQIKKEFREEIKRAVPEIISKQRTQEKIISAIVQPITRQALSIPEPKLPLHLEYLKPVPTNIPEIDLSKLNPLIKDRAVRIIEVNPDEKVVVMGTMGTKPTDIILNKEDISRVINKFSELSKIPTEEGIYRVVVGNLILSAIISEVVGSKFIIKKIITPATIQPMNPQQQPVKKNNYSFKQ